MDKRTVTLAGCALALVLFFALNILGNSALRSMRLDLTEDKRFTLSEGSKQIAANIAEPIHLYLYFSRNLARDLPPVRDYAERVTGFLQEFVRASHGNLELSVIEPEPFSEQEDQAVEQGIKGVPLPGGDALYFGLVGTNATDARETIPYFDGLDEEKERLLEYDLSKLIWTLAHPDKKKVGILSALALEGGGGNPMTGQGGQPRWKILDQLADFFDARVLDRSDEKLPDDIDVLVLIQPRGLAEQTLYQIDQWALAGKPLLVFVDSHCEQDPGDADPSNPMSQFQADRSSNLEPLFKAWGFELVKNKVACDRVKAYRTGVPNRDQTRMLELPVVFLLQLDKECASSEDPVTSLLSSLIVSTPGSLRRLADGTTKFTELLQTSEEAQEIDVGQFSFRPDPQALLASFVPGYEKLTLAARVSGEVKTAFPDGPPRAPGDGEPENADPEAAGPVAGLSASSAPLNLIVVSDADLLADRYWLQEQMLFGQIPVRQIISENAQLFINAIENLAGGKELISIRPRVKTARPFERVLRIKRDAEQRYLAEEQDLQRKLQDADQRLKELEHKKSEGSEELVTAEQRKEYQAALEEKLQTRKKLRNVQQELRKDIERLGSFLKVLNVGLVPLLVSATALALGAWRIRRRGTR